MYKNHTMPPLRLQARQSPTFALYDCLSDSHPLVIPCQRPPVRDVVIDTRGIDTQGHLPIIASEPPATRYRRPWQDPWQNQEASQ